MIVKNEEKNIEKALRWAKKVAFEQIVVDTGSTDSTVEIAERMGAKVFSFEWIDDFSAAKNFAIEQASGNWIAFLDADEYFSETDAKKLIIFLKRIQNDPQMRANYHALNTALVNLDSAGNIASRIDQERVFRNLPTMRYRGRIHEQLSVKPENIVLVDEIEIIHTGYTEEVFAETGKIERNIKILREDLAGSPSDINIKAYLADSLKKSTDEKERDEACVLFNEVIANGSDALPDLLKKAYIHLLNRAMQAGDVKRCKELCQQAMTAIPNDPDLENIYKGL
ncbi:MAG: glycosyltransferase family 2 protein [Oscillospiraceae bacterium]|nr:glycosyltransferase family 2 protein [Oscillospiraceae bacterium]